MNLPIGAKGKPSLFDPDQQRVAGGERLQPSAGPEAVLRQPRREPSVAVHLHDFRKLAFSKKLDRNNRSQTNLPAAGYGAPDNQTVYDRVDRMIDNRTTADKRGIETVFQFRLERFQPGKTFFTLPVNGAARGPSRRDRGRRACLP